MRDGRRKWPLFQEHLGKPDQKRLNQSRLWILTKQEMIGWQRRQLDDVQIVCTFLQTDNLPKTSSLNFLQAGCSSWCLTSSVKALKANVEVETQKRFSKIATFFGKRPSCKLLNCRKTCLQLLFVLPLVQCLWCRRESWSSYNTFKLWQTLLATTRKQSHDHGVLADIYGNVVVGKLTDLMDDMQRVHKKVSQLAVVLLRVLRVKVIVLYCELLISSS